MNWTSKENNGAVSKRRKHIPGEPVSFIVLKIKSMNLQDSGQFLNW